MAILADLERRMEGFDPALVSPPEVGEMVAMLHQGRRALVGIEDMLAEAAIAHQKSGVGPPADDALAGDGETSTTAARQATRRRRTIGEMPSLEASMRAGRARFENVEAVARALDKIKKNAHRKRFLGFDERLTALAERLSPAAFRKELDRYVRRATLDFGLSLRQRQRAESGLGMWRDHDGMYQLRGSLDPEWGGALAQALDSEMLALANARATLRSPEASRVALNDHLRAEALFQLLLRSGDDHGGPRLPLIGCIVDHETLHHGPHQQTRSELWDGTHLPPETLERLKCEALFQEVFVDGMGLPLAVGRRYRTATEAQRLALRSMYATCAWPSCTRVFNHCQIHHVVPWEHGGLTDLDNLLPVCSLHHNLVHEGQWQLELDADHTLTLTRPDGTRYARVRQPGNCTDRAGPDRAA